MKRAVVIGAAMTGLVAARALSETHDEVVVLDRDSLPGDAVPRTGTPQARHLHGLLARGRDLLEEMFPGLSAELLSLGATSADLQHDICWTLDGHPMHRARSGLEGLSMSRALLENRVRARVAALPKVRIQERREVEGLTAHAGRVTEVRVVRLDEDNLREEIGADLVVDASGRGSRSPVWLEELGYERPAEEAVRIGMTYATRHFHREPHHLPEGKGAVVSLSVDNPRGGALAREEGDRWIVTLAGILGDEPPLDDAGFHAFAATLHDPRIAGLIATAKPLEKAVRARFPASVRRRYEHLERFPDGYLVMGDAVCSFNPVYSQGMTVAAEEARVLRTCLLKGDRDLACRFFQEIKRVIDVPWLMATGGDLRFDGVEGRRSPVLRLANAYLGSLGNALERDPAVGRTMLRVANLLDPPHRLFSPPILLRVLRANVRPGQARPGPGVDRPNQKAPHSPDTRGRTGNREHDGPRSPGRR
ncbi:hypothetical protein ACRB68_31420 [Actinomadura sp. RB68]|uniref:FAD-binding domain-containing protein n=1 Tax=Actinomadura macrotermitis TaxID=2585200 RepID=A0A7K0BV57_9ACTN|nr:hypothetical protein [Actinomadura macrotermitis]